MMSGGLIMPVPSISYNKWGARTVGEKKSIVQSLVSRELGNPFFAASGGTIANGFNETSMARHLLLGRSCSSSMDSKKPRKVPLNTPKEAKRVVQTGEWLQISDKVEIHVADTQLWILKKSGASDFQESFFSLEPSLNSGFRCLNKGTKLQGKWKHTNVVGYRRLSTGSTSTYFVTLTDLGILRAYDMMKGKVSDKLQLPKNLDDIALEYKTFDVDETNGEIFVMGKPKNKNFVRVAFCLKYPPWSEVQVVHFKVPVDVNVFNGQVSFLFEPHSHNLHVTSWSSIVNMAKKEEMDASKTKIVISPLKIKFEGTVAQLPEVLHTQKLQSNFRGLLEGVNPPMYFADMKKSLNFLTLESSPQVKYEHPRNVDELNVLPFPDNSNRAVLIVGEENHKVLSFESKYEESGRCLKTVKLDSFTTKPVERPAVVEPERESTGTRRPRRACAEKATYTSPSSPSLLGLTYSPDLDLIATLMANSDNFEVTLYEPLSLRIFKRFSPVYVWPDNEESGSNEKRLSIKSVDFVVEPQFIFVGFQYKTGTSSGETFMLNLLAEGVQ